MASDLTAQVFAMAKGKKGKPSGKLAGVSSPTDNNDDKGEGDEFDDMEAGKSMGKEMAAEDIMSAIKSGDAKKLALALEDFFE